MVLKLMAVIDGTLIAGSNPQGHGVLRLEENADFWTQHPLGVASVVRAFAVMGKTLFAGTREGVYRSTDGETLGKPSIQQANPSLVFRR